MNNDRISVETIELSCEDGYHAGQVKTVDDFEAANTALGWWAFKAPKDSVDKVLVTLTFEDGNTIKHGYALNGIAHGRPDLAADLATCLGNMACLSKPDSFDQYTWEKYRDRMVQTGHMDQAASVKLHKPDHGLRPA